MGVAGEAWERLSVGDRVRAVLEVITDGVTATADDVRGLDEKAVREVTEDQVAPVAEAYRCFLMAAGGGAGRFLQGSDVFYPHVLGLWNSARELLEDNGSEFRLLETDRVILMHQGYQFDFLRGDERDPEVWSYCEIDNPGNAPRHSHDHFTDWLKTHALEQTAAWARLLPG